MTDSRDFYENMPQRTTLDHMLRTAQMHHVQLSAMADVKANIIITVASIVLTLALGRTNDPQFGISVWVLVVFTLLALLLAILAVLPKFRPMRLQGKELPSNFNLLFFGHFANLSEERFQYEMARTLRDEARGYQVLARDIHQLGCYLQAHKYRYLRYSYAFFISGFIFSPIVQVFDTWVL